MEKSLKSTIMQIIPRLDAGGAEQTTLEINRALIAAGWQSLVVSNGGAYAATINKDGGTHIQLQVATKNPISIWANAEKLVRLARHHHVSLIHARSRAPAWSGVKAAKTLNVPLVTTYHGAYKDASALKRWYNSSMVRAEAVIANSEFTRDRIMQAYGRRFSDLQQILHVIPRGADLERFTWSQGLTERQDRIISAWHLHNELKQDELKQGPLPFVFLLPARMSTWKGHEVAIKALKLIIESGQKRNLRLIFCGGRRNAEDQSRSYESRSGGGTREETSQLETDLRRKVNEYGVGDLIHFAGYCEDMPAAYAVADAVLVPSTRPEAFGRVAVEAGAMERVVIAADHGGTKETVIDGKTGFLVPASDPGQLASVMTKVMTLQDQERAHLGVQAREHVTKRYSTAAMCQSTLDVYRNVIQSREMVS